jgi:hypothetical protein|tara:strand:- start:111 stop:284 length:174 start_codon:yes stop_codon:yes gene_type:complete
MNVFGITKESVNFFVNMFDKHNIDEDNIKRFVEVEYKPNDRGWAFEQLKAEKLKKIA